MPVSTAHYALAPVIPPPDTTAVVTYHAQIHAPFDRTGAAPVDTTDPGLLDDLAAVAAALAAQLRATTDG